MEQVLLNILPTPQSVRLTGGCCHAAAPVETLVDGLPAEGYRLSVQPEQITLCASDPAGLFYGRETLAQLRRQYPDALPCLEVEDAPAYPYRGVQVDCARHFFPVEELKKLIVCAARCKLNHLHLHFSDDQGYRIASDVFPRLTSVSAVRAGDHFGSAASDTPEQHYYTKDEVRELVAFAKEQYVEIVPDIDIPGHVTAILAAYSELSCTGAPLEVATREGIYEDILCAGKEEVYGFLDKLFGELCELFPGKYFHIGGDEVPKTRWNTCPCCQKKLREEHLADTRALQGYLANRAAALLKRRGKTVIAWNEAAQGGNLDPEIVLQLWNDDPNDPAIRAFGLQDEHGNPTSPNQGIGAKHIRRGGDVITSNMLSSYCDYPHAFVRAETMYATSPLPQQCEDIPDARAHVRGGEALCWTEYIRTPEELEGMLWPRCAVKAEALWNGKADDFEGFRARLAAFYPVFAECGIAASPMETAFPDEAEARRQMFAFLQRMNPDNGAAYRKGNEAI